MSSKFQELVRQRNGGQPDDMTCMCYLFNAFEQTNHDMHANKQTITLIDVSGNSLGKRRIRLNTLPFLNDVHTFCDRERMCDYDKSNKVKCGCRSDLDLHFTSLLLRSTSNHGGMVCVICIFLSVKFNSFLINLT